MVAEHMVLQMLALAKRLGEVALVAAAALHLSVAWQDFPSLAKNGFLYDDSFYAFQIARNIAQGLGPTFDGVTLTNGFQPLYVFLLVPLFWLAGGDPVLPIHAGLTLLALFTVATAWLLFRIARRYVGDGVAAFVALALVFGVFAVRLVQLQGLDSSRYAAMAASEVTAVSRQPSLS